MFKTLSKLIIAVLLLWGSQISAREVVFLFRVHYDPGMFSVFNTIAGLLHQYDKGDIAGLHVDLGTSGRYYDPQQGTNWWEYFCEPINLGSTDLEKLKIYSEPECQRQSYFTEFSLTRHQVHQLIAKYIKVKRYITEEVDRFAETHFEQHFVIGVHYRGTDKVAEALPVKYDQFFSIIQEKIASLGHDRYKIFVATDEGPFLEYLQFMFPGKVIAQQAMRSENGIPIHVDPTHPFELGKQAITDALLLSRCDLLIRTSSNLSLWSSYFNPDMPVIMLNQRHIDDALRPFFQGSIITMTLWHNFYHRGTEKNRMGRIASGRIGKLTKNVNLTCLSSRLRSCPSCSSLCLCASVVLIRIRWKIILPGEFDPSLGDDSGGIMPRGGRKPGEGRHDFFIRVFV